MCAYTNISILPCYRNYDYGFYKNNNFAFSRYLFWKCCKCNKYQSCIITNVVCTFSTKHNLPLICSLTSMSQQISLSKIWLTEIILVLHVNTYLFFHDFGLFICHHIHCFRTALHHGRILISLDGPNIMDVSSIERDNDTLEAFVYTLQPKLIIIIKLDISSDVRGIPFTGEAS